MNTIKSIKYKNLLLALVCVAATSCGDDFLEIPSKTNLTSQTFFKTQDDFQKAINGAYAPLRTLVGPAWVIGETHSDNAFFHFNPLNQGSQNNSQMTLFTVLSDNSFLLTAYRENYRIIARINQILSSIENATFDNSVKNGIKGQAHFLRALSYFELVRVFGKVPLHLEPVTSLEGTSLPLSEVADIYTQIITDASTAATMLPDKSIQEPGRATSGAANTLLGNVYVVLQRWSDAETALRAVVNSNKYSLLSNYGDVFKPENKNNSESVFEIQFKAGTEGYNNSNYDMIPQPISAEAFAEITGVTNPQPLSGTGYNIPTPDLIAAYDPADLRLDQSIDYITGSDNFTSPYAKKFMHAHTMFDIVGNNWFKYRYSEVLLLLAEALNEQSKSTEALSFLNMVHAHTRTGLAALNTTDQAQLRTLIMNERRVEFALEGKRWFDLVRTGKAVEVITAYGNNVKTNPQLYYYSTGYNPPSAAFLTIDLVFPLPASESLLSPYF